MFYFDSFLHFFHLIFIFFFCLHILQKSVLQQGRLKNGTTVAVKVLSVEGHEAKQGEKEFLSEIAAISNIRHDNLVELLGCCIDGKNRMLVYGYVENLSLFQTLFGKVFIDRLNICFYC